ncbi:hypothetical protein GCM10009838_40300 [Catenulispora subtropica]|uniref:S-adenosyl methyltransferase n=1 Tax=Catenulispora subtropica TaxID=450798 RepID=A0ABN2RW92_9ACTN
MGMTEELGSSLGRDALAPQWAPPQIETSRPHPARIYDYLLGGKDHFPADREAAEVALSALPELRAMARANRAFLGRTVRYLAESGIDQFLDIGTGIPGPGSTGETARAVNPGARVVHVDYDPIVVAHSTALLAGADPERTAVVRADVREPEALLAHERVRGVLDFGRPVAVLMVALLHFVGEDEDAPGIVARFVRELSPGGAVVISHATDGGQPSRRPSGLRKTKGSSNSLAHRTTWLRSDFWFVRGVGVGGAGGGAVAVVAAGRSGCGGCRHDLAAWWCGGQGLDAVSHRDAGSEGVEAGFGFVAASCGQVRR